MEKIRLIWDFRGPESTGTAKHHAIHLAQFAEKEDLVFHQHGHEVLSDMHAFAFIIVDRADMITFRDALRPNRATTA